MPKCHRRRALGTLAVSLHSPQCTSCSPGQSRIDTARSWNSAALGAEAKPASRGRRDRHAGSHRNCKGTRGCRTTFSVEAEVLLGVTMVAKTLSPWSLAVMSQFASSTSLRFQELARAASGLLSVRVGIPPKVGSFLSTRLSHPSLGCQARGLKV